MSEQLDLVARNEKFAATFVPGKPQSKITVVGEPLVSSPRLLSMSFAVCCMDHRIE